VHSISTENDLFGRAGPAGYDCGADAAAGAEDAFDFGPDGISGFDDVFENLVDDVFLEDAEVAVAEEIFLERLEFEAAVAGHIADGEDAEVGKAGFGADGSEFWVVDEDFVAGKLILPGFDVGKGKVEACLGVFVGVSLIQCHGLILPSFCIHGPNAAEGTSSEDLRRIFPLPWPGLRVLYTDSG